VNAGDPIAVIALDGELEIGRKEEIRNALNVPEGAQAVLVDLSDVTYADSIALTELLRFCVNAQQAQVPVALMIRTPQFSRLVQYAGLADAFEIFADAESARAHLAQRLRP
jgi:anti-anti-sigma factor